MFGGDQRKMSSNSETTPAQQPPINSTTEPSTPKNGVSRQQTLSNLNHSKKLQDDLLELGNKIKHHEDSVKYLKYLKNKLDESILETQVAIGKHHFATGNAEPAQIHTEQEIIGNILNKHGNSAAALLCRIKSQPEVQDTNRSLMRDVVGVVATLGKVQDDKISRVLSEYLGQDTMLSVVCRTSEDAKALKGYNKKGSVDQSSVLRALGDSIGIPLDGQFRVISIENIRPYSGDQIADDPQQRLDILKPKLRNGETPSGFLGFAVNKITIDYKNLYGVSKKGHTLRDTLFYKLFGKLQVYESKEDMLKSLSFITHGAISLDGWIIKDPRNLPMDGEPRGDVDVKFPSGSERPTFPQYYYEIENVLKETKWQKNRACDDLQSEQEQLDRARYNYEIKKQEFVQFLAQGVAVAAQYPVGRA